MRENPSPELILTGAVDATEPMRATRPAGRARAGSGRSHHGMLVLASKLRPPAERPGAVVRQPLLTRLSEHPRARLILISAPAGWGKTCLLRDWRLADTVSGTAWVSVDPGDNDPVRFWACRRDSARRRCRC
jgi:hypothetical protein